MLQAKRLPKIRRFLARTDALLPTNIIIRLGQRVSVDELRLDLDDVKDELGTTVTLSGRHYDLVNLNIPMEYASLELIDGQHRLFAFTQAEPATQKSFNLVVLGIKSTPKLNFSSVRGGRRRRIPQFWFS